MHFPIRLFCFLFGLREKREGGGTLRHLEATFRTLHSLQSILMVVAACRLGRKTREGGIKKMGNRTKLRERKERWERNDREGSIRHLA